jgi:hypothetical protein
VSIRFTQYVRTDGRTITTEIDRPPEIQRMADACIKVGVEFESEVLRTGICSLTAEWNIEDGEREGLAHELCENGPEILVAVDRLVTEAFKRSCAS